MGALVWVGEDCLDLGYAPDVLRAVSEMARVAEEPSRWEYLASIPDNLEQDAGPQWRESVRREARLFLSLYDGQLSSNTTHLLRLLAGGGIKSLYGGWLAKGGFTGEKRDKIGRRNCYTEGKRTACAKPAKPVKTPKTGKPLGVVKKAGKQGLPAAKVAAAIIQLRDSGEATPEKILELMAHLTVDGLKEVQAALGLKAGGLKAERARKIAERALYLAKEKKQEPQEPSDAGAEPEPGSRTDEAAVEGTGGGVEEAAGGPGDQGGDQGGSDAGEPARQEAARRLPVTVDEANKRIDRYEKLFRSSGEHQLADWMGMLREHVNAVGTDETLKSLGEEVRGEGEKVQYGGVSEDIPAFARAYLDRHGITPITMGTLPDVAGPKLVASLAPSAEGIATRGEGGTVKPGDVHAALPTLKDKLEESQKLPGLEKSEDINKLMGKKVTGFSLEVMSKLNEVYGEGQWIVKSYGEEAYAGYGIFFPQRVTQINQDAKNTLWASGENLARYGFEHLREEGKVVGVKSRDGKEYKFSLEQDEAGRPSWTVDNSLYGDVRHWALEAAQAAPHEKETSFPEGSFMAQPAFPVVGISDAERAAGVTFKKGQEGRVHIATKDGKATIVPHSTWLKLEHLPVVFENEDTMAMAQAAVDAINALPESERKGQLYAPDVVKTATGYKVVEANPANEAGASGYLSDNPFVIDSYVSHITGREPAHVKFIRKLLSKRAK